MTTKSIVSTVIILLSVHISVFGEMKTESDFTRIMNEADENSLPLVNLTTDIDAVTKEEEITGTIEIFDLKARTNGLEYFKTGCRVKYRGATSLAYDKNLSPSSPLTRTERRWM